MQQIARLCSKERTIHGFVLSRTPVCSPLTPSNFLKGKVSGRYFQQVDNAGTWPRTSQGRFWCTEGAGLATHPHVPVHTLQPTTHSETVREEHAWMSRRPQ